MSRQNLGAIEYHREDAEEATNNLPPTYIVIRIASDIPDKTVIWLVEKIRAKRRDGGAELMVFREPYNPEEVNYPLRVPLKPNFRGPTIFKGLRPPHLRLQDQIPGSGRGDGDRQARPQRSDARVHRRPAGRLPPGRRSRRGPPDHC